MRFQAKGLTILKTSINPGKWSFLNQDGDFNLEDPHLLNYLYFPLANEDGMLAAITPTLGGDLKLNQHTFFLTPVSAEDLHNSRSTRNFWIYNEVFGAWSATGNSARQKAEQFTGGAEGVRLEAGFLWHRLIRENQALGITAEITSFVPVKDRVELMRVKIINTGKAPVRITPTAAIPIYGRSADNLRDHRHVTSLLNRVRLTEYGVELQPTFVFDERGHKLNNLVYGVLGAEAGGEPPVGFFPVVEEFIGEGGSLDWPEAVVKNSAAFLAPGATSSGYEALGGLRFQDAVLEPGASKTYLLILAIMEGPGQTEALVKKYATEAGFESELAQNQNFWRHKLKGLTFQSNDPDYDLWLKWVTLQPVLRRIYGCSFLPHHDYGKGGRGWRDLWQDCLALLFLDPIEVRELLFNNYRGVRIDGSNATIIGAKPGEFLADRNGIARVWMDHGAWPFFTTKLYLDQSGDFAFLFEKQTYFKDQLVARSQELDPTWRQEDGNYLRDQRGGAYQGTILEHILVQLVTQFFNVGEHNHCKLEGADWNDGLDMASQRGESVAFTAFYGYQLQELARLLEDLASRTGVADVELAEELLILFDTVTESIDYDSVAAKRRLLTEYFHICQKGVSGVKDKMKIAELSKDLLRKADWIAEQIRRKEWLTNQDGYAWFNGYYDNNGQRVEGGFGSAVKMTLTGQVFPIMSGAATTEQVAAVVKAVNHYLKDPELGGYRLNTDFGEVQPSLGRCFGFAYGHKENGAFFNHMTVMYAYALYLRGFVKEGFQVLDSIYRMASAFETSKIYPGLPEYFNQKGRGMYHYLTGSASWLLFTLISEVFGVKGERGDLILEPKLVAEQFDASGRVLISTLFQGRKLEITYDNPGRLDYGSYRIKGISINNQAGEFEISSARAKIGQGFLLTRLDPTGTHRIVVELG